VRSNKAHDAGQKKKLRWVRGDNRSQEFGQAFQQIASNFALDYASVFNC
jgi:hypothetical protein